ncbi:Large ribosomal subunit protein uL15 OS=Streptomyces albaduncus OX=68172 GN=rplO PE=3 SV=1 [Streptomyces griseoloalbus]
MAKGAVRKNSLVKVLGQGEISVALQVTVDAVSGSAKEKITAAGGTVTELV